MEWGKAREQKEKGCNFAELGEIAPSRTDFPNLEPRPISHFAKRNISQNRESHSSFLTFKALAVKVVPGVSDVLGLLALAAVSALGSVALGLGAGVVSQLAGPAHVGGRAGASEVVDPIRAGTAVATGVAGAFVDVSLAVLA